MKRSNHFRNVLGAPPPHPHPRPHHKVATPTLNYDGNSILGSELPSVTITRSVNTLGERAMPVIEI